MTVLTFFSQPISVLIDTFQRWSGQIKRVEMMLRTGSQAHHLTTKRHGDSLILSFWINRDKSEIALHAHPPCLVVKSGHQSRCQVGRNDNQNATNDRGSDRTLGGHRFLDIVYGGHVQIAFRDQHKGQDAT
jgi:hypothetical protein